VAIRCLDNYQVPGRLAPVQLSLSSAALSLPSRLPGLLSLGPTQYCPEMSVDCADGTRVNAIAGAADHSQMSLGDGPGLQPRRSFASQRPRQQHQPHLCVPRQRQQQPSQSALTVTAPAPRRGARLIASVETLVRKLSRQRLQSPELSADTNDPQPQVMVPRTASPGINQLLNSSPESTGPSLHLLLPQSTAYSCVDDSLENLAQSTSISLDIAPQCHGPSADDADDVKTELPLDVPSISIHPVIKADPNCDPMDVQYHDRYPPPSPFDSIPAYIEPDTDMIAVDDNYGAESANFEDEATLIESFRARRRAGTLGGSGRRNVDGVPLRFRLSSEAALRCQNLVLSKPRMRKRKKGGERRDSTAPSVAATVDSATSSLAVSVSPRTTLPCAHIEAHL